jgi:hypothetical protein
VAFIYFSCLDSSAILLGLVHPPSIVLSWILIPKYVASLLSLLLENFDDFQRVSEPPGLWCVVWPREIPA